MTNLLSYYLQTFLYKKKVLKDYQCQYTKFSEIIKVQNILGHVPYPIKVLFASIKLNFYWDHCTFQKI